MKKKIFILLILAFTLLTARNIFAEDSPSSPPADTTITTNTDTTTLPADIPPPVSNSPKNHPKNTQNRFSLLPRLQTFTGIVTNISGETVTISTNSVTNSNSHRNSNTKTIDASDAKIMKGLKTEIKVSDIGVGDRIIARGDIVGGTLHAKSIIDGTTVSKVKNKFGKSGLRGGPGFIKNSFSGTVSGLGGGSFTLTTGGKGQNSKSLNINTNNKTVVSKLGKTITLGDLADGDKVTVNGKINDAGDTVTALKIIVQVPMKNITGTITDITDTTITVLNEKDSKTYTVDASTATVIYGHGQKADFSILKKDDAVIVTALKPANPSDTNLTANIIRDKSVEKK